MKLLRLVSGLVVLAGPDGGSAPDPVDRYVGRFVERHRIPSAAIAVVRDGRVVKLAGYGLASLELRVPASPRTVYEIGSITKQFTAEVLLLLVGEGKVDLEAPLARYLPNLPPQWQSISVHQLLTHTSGLPDWESLGLLDYHKEYTPSEFIQLIGGRPLDFAPGERWSYTNSAFPLLGLLIEAVTGEPYERVVVERIFRPAGMTETRFKHVSEVVPNRAAGYADSGGVFRNGEPLRPQILAPNGGILSTAGDIAKWDIALTRGLLVTPSTFEQMAAPVVLRDGRRFNAGMAWFVDVFRGHRLVLHNGSTVAGFSSVIYRYPEDGLFVVVLMNIDRGGLVNQLATGIADLMIPGLSIRRLPERPDPDVAMAQQFLALLKDVADSRDSELLAANLRNPSGPPRTPPSFGFNGPVDHFAFLEREDHGPQGVERFGIRVRWTYRYKLVSGQRLLYYTFELTPDGKVARFLPEED